jgi:hypothetical protein
MIPLTENFRCCFLNYLPHLYTTQKGSSYRFVYEYGYLPLDNDFYMLVIREQKV